ncbi:MAG: hypothetical protein U9R49_16095 [Bacteroidota bacterium]|nr:hypothetical protein [Bacteroidota bacterium]
MRKTTYVFDPQKTSVIIGDSNSQCAVNDSILSRTINLSESAAPYFYSYLKLKKVLNSKSNIDTIILSIAPHNIFDNGWLFDEQVIYSNFGRYLPIMEWNDFKVLLKGNPTGTIGAFRAIPISMVAWVKRKIFHEELDALGGYFNLERDILEDQILKLAKGEALDFFRIPESFAVSEEEEIYLKKIEVLCREHDKELMLLYLPKRAELLAHEKYGVREFYAYYQQTLSSIPMMDYSQLSLPKDSFADLVHLNQSGATWFSSALRDHGFQHIPASPR